MIQKHVRALSLALLFAGAPAAMPVFAQSQLAFYFQTSYDESAKKHEYTILIGASETTPAKIVCAGETLELTLQPSPQAVTLKSTYDGMAKVYADPTKINVLDLHSIRLADIVWDGLTELEWVDISNNKLRAADLTPMTKLRYASLGNNPYSRSGRLTVGGGKTLLEELYVNDTDYMSADFSLTEYPALKVFDGSNAMSITVVDLSNCPNLLNVNLSQTQIAAINPSYCPNLTSLNVADTNISNIDLSASSALTTLNLSKSAGFTGPKFETLDLQGATSLQDLNVSGNELLSLDATPCPMLATLNASGNQLKEVNVAGMTALANLDLSGNNLTFATLPEPSASYTSYSYAQNPMQVRQKYAAGAAIDFSESVLRAGTETTVYAKYAGGETVPETAYAFNNGVVTFAEVQPKNVTLFFGNSMFPDAELQSTSFAVVTPEEAETMTKVISFQPAATSGVVEMKVGMAGASEAKPGEFYVDFGNGVKQKFQALSEGIPDATNAFGQITGNTVTVYTEDPTLKVTAFDISGTQLSTLDVTAAKHLAWFEAENCGLNEIDLKYNAALQSVNLNSNNLYSLNLEAANTNLPKNKLHYVKAANNQIRSYSINSSYTLKEVDLNHNQIYSFPLELASNLRKLDLNTNLLDTIALGDCVSLEELNIGNNKLSVFEHSHKIPLKKVDLSGNNIYLPQLPLPGTYQEYVYAPQSDFQLPGSGCSAVLTDEYFTVNGQTTQYEWLFAATKEPVPADKIAEREGNFGFLDSSMGRVYCRITHAAFPDFEGENAIYSTPIQPVDAPTLELFNYVPAQDEDITNIMIFDRMGRVYINWQDDGIWLEYMGTTDRLFAEGKVLAGKQVRVNTYTENLNPTLVSIRVDDENPVNAFSSVDLSGLDKLTCITVSGGCPIETLKLPAEMGRVGELCLEYMDFEEFDLSNMPSLYLLRLSNGNLKTLDISMLKKLTTCYVQYNPLESFVYDNPLIWEMDLTGCGISELDLTKLPAMRQLHLTYNNLTELDITPVNLVLLRIGSNKFNFATLPIDYKGMYEYRYYPQAALEANVVDGQVDLNYNMTAQNGTETQFYWFIGMPTVDETGAVVGDQLRLGTDYKVDGGKTTFLKPVSGAICVMLNPTFPRLMMVTDPVTADAWSSVEINAADFSEPEYYDLNGLRVSEPRKGQVYVVRQGDKTAKAMLK